MIAQTKENVVTLTLILGKKLIAVLFYQMNAIHSVSATMGGLVRSVS
jgi:hypothetical protein